MVTSNAEGWKTESGKVKVLKARDVCTTSENSGSKCDGGLNGRGNVL